MKSAIALNEHHPNIIMNGEEHHCQEEQGIVGSLGNPRVEQK
jgi:hypothetical protein